MKFFKLNTNKRACFIALDFHKFVHFKTLFFYVFFKHMFLQV